MQEITYEEFLQRLTEYGTAVHCEKYANNYKLHADIMRENESLQLHYDRGCVIMAEDYEYQGKQWVWRNVHQVEPEADIDAVTNAQLADAREYGSHFDDVSLNVVEFLVSGGDLPPEKNQYLGWRNYTRMGEPILPDARVRILTEADAQLVEQACAPSFAPDGDTWFGRTEAGSFSGYNFAYAENCHIKLYGIFDGDTLAGMTTCSYEEDLRLAWLRDLFVTPAYRRKGFGRALVSTALSEYPDVKWHYQAARDNVPSVSLAKSMGFTLEGAGLFIT